MFSRNTVHAVPPAMGAHVCTGSLRLLLGGIVAALLVLMAPGAQANGAAQTGSRGLQAPMQVSAKVVVIGNDKGGSVAERMRQIRKFQASGVQVQIRGEYCLSACTLYLGLKNVCVRPETVFGFHGPSSRLYGVALRPASFERWSRRMAEQYPKPLRGWFLEVARKRITGFETLSGREIISLGTGIHACRG